MYCGADLQAWGAMKTHSNVEEIKRLQNRVKYLNMRDTTEKGRVEFLEVSKQLDELLLKQEIYWHQRSRIPWLKYGDENTKFFHSKATQRRRKNFIKGIRDQ